jgi:TatD DNase family protein
MSFPEEELNDIVVRARNNGCARLISIGAQLNDFPRHRELKEKFPDFISITAGIHPDYCNAVPSDQVANEATKYLSSIPLDAIVGVGEIGLDYKDVPTQSVKQLQKELFAAQLDFAQTAGLPVCIHMREAVDDVFDVLKDFPNLTGVFHCFCEDRHSARRALDFGFYISFSGIVTFKNAKAVQDSATYVPLSRMLIETDAPDLAPTPYRGKRNEPAFVRLVCEFIAQLHEVEPEEVAEQTRLNTERLYPVTRVYARKNLAQTSFD